MTAPEDWRKVIPGEHGVIVRRWEAPGVSAGPEPVDDEPDDDGDQQNGLLTAEQLERIQRDAYDEGFALGRREGFEAGREDAREQARRLAGLMDGLAQPYEELDEAVEEELVALASAIARHLVRRELRTQPDEIVRVAREALRAMPGSARNVRLYLSPADAALVREALPAADAEHPWKIVENPALTAGGCEVESEHSRVDARVESRLNAAIAQALGGERRHDTEDGGDDG